MSCDLLSESVNVFLDDFETSLCLPILVVMVLCTAQFVFNHVFGIGCTIYQNIRKPIAEGEEEDTEGTNMIGKLIKGILNTLGIGKADNKTAIKNPSSTNQSREEDWDYCEDDVE
ncbi:uncharacterized protein LOC126852388 [Cataglyphis hispanica]|uniref:uncharacterized protein LOC126852388 n=1 Tax=Cataglyphis hispanica TaxID=1086592 RepID=UPI00217FCDCB|nr:uncharacterized protein LOC126852388 [Cataglyphis hispanica]